MERRSILAINGFIEKLKLHLRSRFPYSIQNQSALVLLSTGVVSPVQEGSLT